MSSTGQIIYRYHARAKVTQVMNFSNFMNIPNIAKVNTQTPIMNFIALIQLQGLANR